MNTDIPQHYALGDFWWLFFFLNQQMSELYINYFNISSLAVIQNSEVLN